MFIKCSLFCRALTPDKGIICEMRSKTLPFWNLSCVTVNIFSYVFLINFRLFMTFCSIEQCFSSAKHCLMLIIKNPFDALLRVHVVIDISFFFHVRMELLSSLFSPNSLKPPHPLPFSIRLLCLLLNQRQRPRQGQRELKNEFIFNLWIS